MSSFRACLAGFVAILSVFTSIEAATTATTSSTSFTIDASGSSPLGTATIQSGADLRFGAAPPNYTIGAGHDILLGRALGGNADPTLHIALKAPDSLTRADIAGDWHYYEYQVNEAANFLFSTSTGTATLQSDGSLLLDGSPLGTFSIAPGQTVSAQTGSETITFAANASKDVLISTSSQSGKPTLRILVRPESGGATAEMAGTWTVGSFGIDFNEDPPDTYYDGDTLTANANGTVTLPDGSATWSADGSGHITFSDGEGSTTLSVNQSRTLLAYTESPTEQNHEGALVLRASPSPDIAALAGNWTLLTFAFTEAPDISIVETYYPVGTTLAARQRYVDGMLDGTPAHQQWDENGNLIQSGNYDQGALTYQLLRSFNDDVLYSLTETYYEDEKQTSQESTTYHPDGITIAEHRLETLTDEGYLLIQNVFAENGTQTSHNQYLDNKSHGLQKGWNSLGNPISIDSYDHGIRLYATSWQYFPNGQTSLRIHTDYSSGQAFRTTTSWRSDGTRRQVTRGFNPPYPRGFIAHGTQESYDEGGHLVEEDPYLFGKRHGFFRQWFPGGSPAPMSFEAEYKDGKLDGTQSEWNEDGTLIYSQDYVKDLKHGDSFEYEPPNESLQGWSSKNRGIWEYDELRRVESWSWDANSTLREHQLKTSNASHLYLSIADYHLREDFDELGQPTSYIEREQGEYHGIYRIWHDGVLVSDYLYNQGRKHGRCRGWYDDGTLGSDLLYENGIKHGPFETYDDNGDLAEVGVYDQGQLHGTYKTYDSYTRELTTYTYDHDVLDGPFESPNTSGSYANGLKQGEWTNYNQDGSVYSKEDYANGVPHGATEYYSNGSLNRRERYTEGLRDGLQENFFPDGSPSYDTTYENGIEVGPRNYYQANGRLKETTSIDVGLAHGSHKTYDSGGRITTSGSYNHGVLSGIWTTYTYDANGNRKSYTTDFGNTPPTNIVKGLRGTVTNEGKPIPGVTLRLGEDGPSTFTNEEGKYVLELGDYSASTELSLEQYLFDKKTVTVTLPSNFSYATQNVTLSPPSSPALALGEPSTAGTYFLRDVNFPVHYHDLQIPNNGGNALQTVWIHGDRKETFSGSLTINPGNPAHVDDNGYAGTIVAQAAKDIQTDPISLPTYHIAPNPAWAKKLGTWKTYSTGDPDEPGSYLLTKKWPQTPFSFGISRATLTPAAWAYWSLLPVLGEGDFGIFDAQAILDLEATTDGGGEAYLSGNGTLKVWKTESRAKLLGDADIVWKDSLYLSNAKLLIDAKMEFSEDATLLTLFPPLHDLQGGDKVLKPLNDLVKISVIAGGGISSHAGIQPINGELSFLPSDVKLSLLVGTEFKSIWLNPDDFEASFKGRVSGTWGLEKESAYFKSLDSELTATLKWVVYDVTLVNLKETYSTDPNASSSPSDRSLATPHFVQPTFAQNKPYATFHDPNLMRIQSFSTEPQTLADEPDALVSNIYPYAQPAIAQKNGQSALVYVHYDPDRPIGQSTQLYYAIDNGEGYSTPKPLHSQARGDFRPQLAYTPTGQLIAIWETSQLDQVADDFDDRIAGLEIAWSLYDSASDTWATPAQLSDNAYLDHQVTLSATPQGIMLAWHSNPANPLFPSPETPDSILYTTWTGNGFAAPQPLPYTIPSLGQSSLAFDGTNAALAWVQDTDEDLTTSEDTELFMATFDGENWTDPTQLTHDSLPDASPTLFCLEGDSRELVWSKDAQLVHMSDWITLTHEPLFEEQTDAPTSAYDLTCNDSGSIAILWRTESEEQSDLHYALYDSNTSTWSHGIQITDTTDIEHSPSLLLDSDSQITVAYLSEDPATEQRDLHILSEETRIDLAITDIDIQPSANSENQFDITLTLLNQGNLPSGTTTASLHLGDPDNGGELLASQNVNLAGGESTAWLVTTSTLPANATGILHARIDPDNTISESDETNNTLSSDLNPIELAADTFTWNREHSDETTLRLDAVIANPGRSPATNIPVEIRNGDQSLYSTTIASLDPDQTAPLQIDLHQETILAGTGEATLTLLVDPNQTLDQSSRSDNQIDLLLSTRILADSDLDGLENAWEELHFGTLDRDGSGDFDRDGLSDAFEFLTANDPLDPASKFPFQIIPENQSITFPSVLGRQYQILLSTDLETWIFHSAHNGTGNPIEVPLDTTAPTTFYRIQISLH